MPAVQGGHAMGSLESLAVLIKLLFAVGVIAAIGWFVVRPLIRHWQQQPDPDSLMPKFVAEPDQELQIPTDPNRKLDRNELIAKARSDPRLAALVLQQWIREKEKGRPRRPPA
jgi:flagellar biosynthesis/type III secretory pathway M-ring protein FliF/YscJ